MSELPTKLRYILQFFLDKGANDEQAREEICAVYGRESLSKATAKRWFSRLRSGNVDVQEAPRIRRPITKKVNGILAKVEQDRHISSHDIANDLNIHHQTVLSYLEEAGYKKKLDVWVPHDRTRKNVFDRISICESLLKRNKIEPFLKRLITNDEKWITYGNNVRKKSWSKQGKAPQSVAKPTRLHALTPKKVILCVWWDWKGIVHHELLPPGRKIDSDLYCRQLARLQLAIQKKRPELISKMGVVYHADNARPHTSLTTRQKLRELGWEVLMHPPYSPDLTPSDYHLFPSLQNSLNGVKLVSKEACKNHVAQFFDQKPQEFYSDGIMVLPEKWQKVIEQNGAYVVS
ncbi:histone-lysine N-methyltransferase SETMAR-like [Harpegnathos saltator]|uniref:histone-lysine N-methyltransferase SETMAR-like n=1 Tax=Harpegnathos saltator TaxID=610380 RepID=UPI000DBEF282|nr:histone-lysine N-methyltransferase SETMAR-like [Harpegnathos saltator]